jgi:type II secretory pathway component GspD/PulD (secretin)
MNPHFTLYPQFLKSTNASPLATRKTLAGFLAMSLLVAQTLPLACAQVLDTSRPVTPMHGNIAISRDVNIAARDTKVSLSLREAPIADVLNTLAQQGNFNIILDESVQGKLTIDIKNISINKALEYIFTVAELSYNKDGNTVIVASKAASDTKNLNARTLKAIPVLYRDASVVAQQLNNTIFKVARPNGSTSALASFDMDSNSLLIMGTDADIKLVADTLREIDVPRNRKVYQVRHNAPDYIANVLAATFFTSASSNNSNSSGSSGSSGGSGSSTGASGGSTGGSSSSGSSGGSTGGSSSSGSSSNGGSSSGGSSGGGSSGGSGTTATLTNFTTGGVTFIAEPISATLTVLASDEQLALIDSIIDQIDVMRPQVEIEVSLVEIQNSELKSFRPLWGTLNLGKEASLNLNVLDSNGNPSGLNVFHFTRDRITGLQKDNLLSSLDISQSHQSLKGKVLANPTIVALDGMESTITITDQVPSVSQSITVPTVGAPITTNTITTQDAGVTLKITPTVTNDGSVTMKLSPEVSQPGRTVTAGATSTVLISKRTLEMNGVRVKDGETLVIGGLIRQTSQLDISRVPGLDKLPIISAMFRAVNNNSKDKTELVLMVTPHILRENAVTYFSANKNKPAGLNAMNQVESVKPVSLPRFIGPDPTVAPKEPLVPLSSSQSKPDTLQTGTTKTISTLSDGKSQSKVAKLGHAIQENQSAVRYIPENADSKPIWNNKDQAVYRKQAASQPNTLGKPSSSTSTGSSHRIGIPESLNDVLND